MANSQKMQSAGGSDILMHCAAGKYHKNLEISFKMDLQNTESPIVNFRRLVRKAVRNDARAYKKLKLRTTRRVIAKMVNI